MEAVSSSFGGHKNFTQLSKIIESNKIQVSFIEDTMKKQVDRNRETFGYPASIAKAKIHRRAAKFGFKKNLQGEIPVVCPCCRLRMDNEPISVCYSTSQSSLQVQHNYEEFMLTPGIAVFFSMYKASIFYIFLLSAFTAYDLYSVDICQVKDIYPDFSLPKCANSQDSTAQETQLVIDIVFLVSLVVSIIFFFIYRKVKNSWHRSIYSKNQTEQSYTVMISNIPVLDFPRAGEMKAGKSEFFYRKHLQTYLQDKIRAWAESSDSWQRGVDSNENDYLQVLNKNEGSLKSQDIVKSISLCYNLSRLEIIDDTRASLIEQQCNKQEQGNQLIDQIKDNKDQDRFSTIPKKIEFINDCRIVLNNQYASDNSFLFNLTHFVGHAFVSFQYQHYSNYFLDQYQRNPHAFAYNGSVLKFTHANDPNDVNWKNLRLSNSEKQRIQINSYFIIILIITLEFVLLFGLNFVLYNPHSILDVPFTESPQVFILAATVVIIFANTILKKVISILVASQRHKSKVNETTTYMNKSVLAQVISSCLTLFFLNILQGSHTNLHFYANGFIAYSSAIEILYQLIHPSWIFKEIKRWFRYRNLTNQDTVNTFQCKLNKQFEFPEFQIAKRYSYFIYKIFVAIFFGYEAPLGMLITFITLGIMYWIDKINLFKRSSLYFNGNISVSNHALKMLQFSLLVYAVFVFYFSSNESDSLNILALCGVGFALLYVIFILLAPLKLERLVFGREAASDKYIYDDCVSDGKFYETYWHRNPATTLVQEFSVTGKEMVTNPALMRRYADPKDYPDI